MVEQMTTPSARQAATAHLQQAGEAINAMFDRQDELDKTLTQLADTAAGEANVFIRAQAIIDQAETVTEQLEALRNAAGVASEHRAKRDLARDLEASPNAVFPPQAASTTSTTIKSVDEADAA